MKKIISLLLILSFFSMTFVHAEEKNKIYVNSKDNGLYYDSNQFDEDIFLHHLDLLPGKVYEDELWIENNTNYSYDLYFKIKEREQSDLANELLDNIAMQIYLDEELIYDGMVNGKDYLEKGVDLQNSVFLGNYSKNSSGKLVVKTMLDPEYSNIENNELASLDWEFYAYLNDEIKVVNPGTNDSILDYLVLIIISVVGIVSILFIICKHNSKKKILLKK